MMKMKINVLACMQAFTWCCASAGLGAQTLSDVVQKAVADYPSVLAAKSKVAVNQADIDRARAAHYPQLAYGFTKSQYSSGALPSSVEQESNTPTLKMNLWSGGRIEADADRAKAMTLNSELALAATLDDVALLATEAYINWAKAVALYALGQKNLEEHRVTFDDIRKIVQIDSGRRIDLEQAQVRLDNAQLSVIQRQTDVSQAEERLRRMWKGNLPSKPLGVADVADPKLNGPMAAMPENLWQALQSVNDDLPVIAQQVAQVKAAEASVRMSKANYWPTVDVSVTRQLNTASLPYQQDTFSQVQLNMPLYNGGATSAQVTAAQKQLESQNFSLDDVRLQAREKVAVAWQEWKNTQARAQQVGKQSATSDKIVEGYRQQFRLGRRQLLDLLNIQAETYGYQSSTVQSEFDEKIARARLLAATGVLAKRFTQ